MKPFSDDLRKLRLTLLGTVLLGTVGCGSSNGSGPEDAAGEGGSAGERSSVAGAGTMGGFAGTGDATGGEDNAADVAEKGLCAIRMACQDEIVDEPKVPCTFELRDSEGTLEYSDHAGVERRGRSSQSFPKPNYGLELRTATDQDNPANLLGMGKEADWVLDGAWADRSFMRNRLVFGLFRDIGKPRWAPQARYCELTLNGQYAGIYVLLEKIKRDDDRVELPDDDGTGSTFLVKQDDEGELSLPIGWASGGDRWALLYPTSEEATDVQVEAVQAWMDRLRDALRSDTPSDILNLLDPAAMIDWILVEELAKNIDGFNLSLFFARASGSLASPIPWDMDLGFGQPTLQGETNESPEGWIYNRTALITTLAATSEIRQGLGPRWRQLRAGHFSNLAIFARLDGYATILEPAAIDRNFALWPIEEVDFQLAYEPYSFYDVTSYADEVTHLRTWIEQRLAWLDANIDSYPRD
jgi:hypothetical protein